MEKSSILTTLPESQGFSAFQHPLDEILMDTLGKFECVLLSRRSSKMVGDEGFEPPTS